jgi:hypothetical protein
MSCWRDSRSGTGDARVLKSVAIVTRASQGIGRATAIRLARDFRSRCPGREAGEPAPEDRGRKRIRGC